MHKITIQQIEALNHNVRRIVTDKPADYTFKPGQATDVAVDREGLRGEKRPFTFTSLPSDPHIEFTIKIYPDHHGVTAAIDTLKPGDSLLIGDPWGAITFQGPGTFIAGGAGLTPFLAILRDQSGTPSPHPNRLIFSNHSRKDLFLEKNLLQHTQGNLLLTYTEEKVPGAEHGRIDLEFLKKHIDDPNQFFYVCGPPEMVESVSADLKKLGASPEKIVTEDT